MRIIIFLTFIFIVSCASNKSNEQKIDLDKITNEDFKKETPVPYSRDQDYYKTIKDSYSQALNEETLALLDEPKNVLDQNKDFLASLTKLCYEKKFNEAFSLADGQYEKYRNNPIYWNQVGTCFYLKGESRKAFLYYNKALEFNTSYIPSLNNIGVIYAKRNEDQKALVAFKKARVSGNFSKTPRFNIGQLYLKYGLYAEATSIFTPLYNENKNDLDISIALANAKVMSGDFKGAISLFSNLDSKWLKTPYVGVNYALALYELGDKANSAKVFKRVDDSHLGNWNSYYKDVKNYIGVK